MNGKIKFVGIVLLAVLVIGVTVYSAIGAFFDEDNIGMEITSRTEYIGGDVGQVLTDVRFAISNMPAPATCWASAIYPDKTAMFTNEPMSGTLLGTYNYSFIVPIIEGVYEYQAICEVSPGRNVTRSKAFHVSSAFRLLSELIQDQVRFIDQSMDLQRHDQPVVASWKLDSTEDVNITSVNCWVENDDGGFSDEEYDVERYDRNWCVSYYPPNTGPFILARNNDYFPGGSILGATPIVDQVSIVFSSPFFELDVTHFLTTVTSTTASKVDIKLEEVDTGLVIVELINYTWGSGTIGTNKNIVSLDVSLLKKDKEYNLSITKITGDPYNYNQSAASILPLIDTNPYGLEIKNTTANVLWFSIYGNASYRPSVTTTINQEADSFKASWIPLERGSNTEYVYPGGTFASTEFGGESYPTCGGITARTTELNKSLYFYHNHNYNTVCDITYEVNNAYATERLEHQTFLQDRGLRAVIVK